MRCKNRDTEFQFVSTSLHWWEWTAFFVGLGLLLASYTNPLLGLVSAILLSLVLLWRWLGNFASQKEGLAFIAVGFLVGWAYFFSLDDSYFRIAALAGLLSLFWKQLESWGGNCFHRSLTEWLSPIETKVQSADQTKELSFEQLQAGDEFSVQANQRIPVDAILVDAEAKTDESHLKGLNSIRQLSQGEKVWQGSRLLEGKAVLRAEKNFSESSFELARQKLRALLSQHPEALRPAVSRAKRWMAVLFLLALGSGIYWWQVDAQDPRIYEVPFVLFVLACPHLFVLSQSFSYLLALRNSLRNGIWFQDLQVVDRVDELTNIAFDKTGTLTEGQPRLERIVAVENVSNKEILKLAASCEQDTGHPYAKAIRDQADQEGIRLEKAKHFHFEPGKGVRADLEIEGKERSVCVGSLLWLFENGYDSTALPDSLRWEAEGSSDTVLWLGQDGRYLGIIILRDEFRPEAHRLVEELSERGLEVGLITGDSENVAREIGKKLRLSFWHFGALPEEKATLIRRLSQRKKKGVDFVYPKVAFIGDGFNEEPAFQASYLSVALGDPTLISRTSADSMIVSRNLTSIRNLFKNLQQASQLMFYNSLFIWIYHAAALPLGFGILAPYSISPIWAPVVMGLGSAAVLLNSLRLIRH